MKKITVLIILVALALTMLASCGKTPEGTTAPGGSTAAEGTAGTSAPAGTETSANEEATTSDEPIAEPEHADNVIMGAFADAIEKNPNATAQEIANSLLNVRYLKNCEAFKAEYYYPAFDFSFTPAAKDAYYIADNFSSKSNIVYVFQLEDGADADAFVESLKDNADMNWQYTDTPADHSAYVAIGNYVLFMLYNDSIEEVDDAPIAKKPREAVDIFRAYLSEHPTATALEIAEYLASHQHIGQLYTQQVEEGRLTGFSADINGFADGAIFSPMMMPSSFIGYVFKAADSGDIDAFTTQLKNNANVAWNVCVVVNTVIVEAEGNYVIFMMCNE